MSTIDVQGRYLIHAGDSLSFIGETAFDFIARPSGKPSELAIRGGVAVDFSAATGSQTCIVGTSDQGPARLDIAQGGVLSIIGQPADQGDTWGFILAADGSRVVNRGLIEAQGGAVIGGMVHGADSRLVNVGQVELTGDTVFGLITGGESPTLVNRGDLEVDGESTGRGVMLLSHTRFNNTGQISVHGASESVAVYVPGDGSDIRNSGTIQATYDGEDEGGSLGIVYSPWGGLDRVFNSGLISADVAIRTIDSNLVLINIGEIDGQVSLFLGTDLIRNDGVIDGDISLGVGDDRYFGAQGSHLGVITGDLGNDRLVGGTGGDLLYGDGVTAETYDGADLLKGGRGEDSLHGGGGADTLWGGADADQLHGGAGADVFAYAKASDSVAGHADFITDLEASDRIDLSAIDADATQAGDQAFVLVSALDGHAAQAALSYDVGANLTTLSLDTDGDGAADTLIHLAGDQTGFTGLVL